MYISPCMYLCACPTSGRLTAVCAGVVIGDGVAYGLAGAAHRWVTRIYNKKEDGVCPPLSHGLLFPRPSTQTAHAYTHSPSPPPPKKNINMKTHKQTLGWWTIGTDVRRVHFAEGR